MRVLTVRVHGHAQWRGMSVALSRHPVIVDIPAPATVICVVKRAVVTVNGLRTGIDLLNAVVVAVAVAARTAALFAPVVVAPVVVAPVVVVPVVIVPVVVAPVVSAPVVSAPAEGIYNAPAGGLRDRIVVRPDADVRCDRRLWPGRAQTLLHHQRAGQQHQRADAGDPYVAAHDQDHGARR